MLLFVLFTHPLLLSCLPVYLLRPQISSLFAVFHFLPLSLHLNSTRADQRNLEKSTPSISRPVTGDQPLNLSNPRITRGTHRDRLLMQTSMFEPLSCTRNKAMLLLPLNQAFFFFPPFISGCLLAGCCLSVAAVGTLGAVHSWSFVLCGVFIMGGGFSQRPSPSVSGTSLFPAEPTFPASTFTPNLFHSFNRLTGVALLLINNYCLVKKKKGLKKLSSLSFAKSRQSTKVKHFTTLLIR